MTWSKADILLINRARLITLTTAEGALYGFTFALYIFCARSLYLQLEDRDRRRQRLFMLLYMSFVMALALSILAVDAQSVQISYVNHANYPGGGYGYAVRVFGKSPAAIVGYAAVALLVATTSGIQIWRLWVIWKGSRYSFLIVVLPTLSLLADLGLEVADIVMIARSELTARLDALFFYGITAFSLCTSITVTVPIITRIFMARRKHMKIMGQTDCSSQYTSIISMLIESFALESVWMILQLCFGVIAPNPVILAVNDFFANTQPFIQLLAYLLVIHRVASGRGWKEDTEEKLTTLQWNRDELQTTQMCTRASIPITQEA